MAGKLVQGVVGVVVGVCSLLGQQQNTVYQHIFSNATSIPLVSQRLTNVGQSEHILTVQLTNAPGQTCIAPFNFAVADAEIDGSFDDVNYHQITPSLISIYNDPLQSDTVASIAGIGAYPYLRAVVLNFDTVHCQLTANYTGLLYPIPLNTTLPNQNANITGISSQTPRTSFSSTSIGSAIIYTAPTPNRHIQVNGVYIWSATAQTVSFYDGAGGTSAVVFSIPLLANVPVFLPSGTYVLFGATYGNVIGTTASIGMTTTSAGPVFGVLNFVWE